MNDPVVGFDNERYERKAIEEYLKIHNKSPVTGEQAEWTIVFPDHRLKAQINKYMKENMINDD